MLAFDPMSWNELTHRFWPVAVISFVLSLIMTPVCRKIAHRRGIVDKPDAFLKPHEKPIPYLGGVAIFVGWVSGLVIAWLLNRDAVRSEIIWGIAGAGLLTMLVGLFDDLRVMSARVKLATNIVVAIFLLYLGLGDKFIYVFANQMGVAFTEKQRWLELLYSVPITLFIVVGSCNATNLIDGLDGLCAGVLGLISLGFFVLAAYLTQYRETEIASERVVFALAMLGAAAGFLPYNLNPATIFLGDAGSMLLGFNAAVIMLLFAEEQLTWFMASVMVFGLPVGDMLLTLVRRWRNGRPLMLGDRSHFYDQLRDRGLTVKRVVGISYVLTLVFVSLGVAVIFLQTRYVLLLYTVAFVGAIALIWKFNMASLDREALRKELLADAAGSTDSTERV